MKPYKLLDYYDTKDADVFFGRQLEIQKLESLINSHRLVLLYGASGAGKTSLLLAGVGAILERIDHPFTLIHVRSLEDPIQAIGQAVQRKLPVALQEPDTVETPKSTPQVDLHKLNQTIDASFDKSELRSLCVLNLQIDYEALPEGNKADKVLGLITYCQRRGRINDLIAACQTLRPQVTWPKNPTKSNLQQSNSFSSNGNFIDFLNSSAKALDTTLVIALDQFEELFIRFDTDVRAAFFAQLGKLYNATDIPVKLIFSLREDFLPNIDEIQAHIPEVFYTQMRLKALDNQQARQAIMGPIERLDIRYDPALINQLLLDLTNNETAVRELQGAVMPPQLQLVCNALFEHAQLNKQTSITLADYETLNGARGILNRYLEGELRRFPRKERGLAKAILAELGNPTRTEKTATCDDLAAILVAKPDEVEPVLRKMVLARLIRPLDLMPTVSYELVHQYLVQEIETPREARTRKAVEELVAHELRISETLGTLISPDRLKIISEWHDRLDLNEKAQQLIEKSLKKQDQDEQEQIFITQSDKTIFLNQLVTGIDKEITSPIASIVSNSHFLQGAVAEIKETVAHMPALLDDLDEAGDEQRQIISLFRQRLSDHAQDNAVWNKLDDIQDISDELKQAAKQMTGLIKALSNFAQRDEGKFYPVEVHTILNAAELLLAHQFSVHGISLESHFIDYLTVHGSPGQLIELFMNVLMSCIEALKSKRAAGAEHLITIKTDRDGSWAVITFTHDGDQFESQEFQSIFKQDGAQREKSVTQFGLSIAYQIVKHHSGSITIPEEQTEKATLIIKLPSNDQG